MPSVPVVILAGGRSRRFGSEKAVASLGGARLIDVLLDQLVRQSSGPIAISGGTKDPHYGRELDTIVDELGADLGPLAGVHSAMVWAKKHGHELVMTIPVDAPILPCDYVGKLGASAGPTICTRDGERHFLHGIWPVALHDDLATFIGEGGRAAKHWVERCKASEADVSVLEGEAYFWNVNTKPDLQRLEELFQSDPNLFSPGGVSPSAHAQSADGDLPHKQSG